MLHSGVGVGASRQWVYVALVESIWICEFPAAATAIAVLRTVTPLASWHTCRFGLAELDPAHRIGFEGSDWCSGSKGVLGMLVTNISASLGMGECRENTRCDRKLHIP